MMGEQVIQLAIFALMGALCSLIVERLSRDLNAPAVSQLHTGWLTIIGVLGFMPIPLRLDTSEWVWGLGIGSVLLYVCACDLRAYLIPNGAVIILSSLALVRGIWLNALVSSVTGGLFALVLLAIIAWITGHMGAGDVKLATAIGLFVGWPDVLSALYWGMFVGAVVVLILLLLKIRKRQDTVAYGPYLCLGVWLFWLLGS